MMTLTSENESLANAKVAELTFKKLVILPRKQPSLSEGLALFALPASLNLSSFHGPIHLVFLYGELLKWWVTKSPLVSILSHGLMTRMIWGTPMT